MYIRPNSRVEYFADVGLSPDQADTLFFATTAAKDAYFDALTPVAYENELTYIYKDGKLRSTLPISTMYNVTYMRFKNTSFENKWFYAFVTSIDYVNNGLTEVTFELDIMLTWMGDFELGECFVERQHVTNDTIGANIASENLDTGDYIYENSVPSGFLNHHQKYNVSVLTTLNDDGSAIFDAGNLGSNMTYSAARRITFNIFNDQGGYDATALNTFFNNANEKELTDNIVSVYMTPKDLPAYGHTPTAIAPITKPYTTIDGYTPANNKLFCYPYNYLEVTNSEGNEAVYRYEFFSDQSVNFNMYCAKLNPVEVVAIPLNYKGISENINESITMGNFPQCSYINDSFKAFLAQRTSGTITGAINAAAIGFSTGGAAGAIAGAGFSTGATLVGNLLTDVTKTLAGTERAGMPSQLRGSNTNDVIYAANKKDFYFNKKQITSNYAIMIDDYFTMYGYAVRQCLVPKMNCRKHWTYVKTLGCIVHGDLPSSDARAIEAMFDSGIRFWNNHNNIGKFQELKFDNTVV